MFLQAIADDSRSDKGDKRLYIAGYLNRSDQWALFSDAWAEQLNEPPKIEYLKMVEAQHLRGQFKGWPHEARNKKLNDLSRVIKIFLSLFPLKCR